MGRPLVRLGDISAGHCYSPRPNVQGSPDTFTNGLPNHRQGDYWPTHCCGKSCHDGVLLLGSPTYFTNGLGQGGSGDAITCGDSALQGSPDSFVGP